MDLTGKKALITGVAGALGQGIAQVIAAAGADLVGVHHDQTAEAEVLVARLQETGRRVFQLEADISRPEQAAQLVAQSVAALGQLDIVIILPHPISPKPFMEQVEAEWDNALAVNVAGACYVAQAAARQMVSQGNGGRIIFISSAASEMPFHETSLMGTSLAAVNTIAQVAALELGRYQITVNVVAPGWIEAAGDDSLHFSGAVLNHPSAEDIDYITGGIPLGRVGRAQEVGQVCAFLASEAASYVNGVYLKVDGGYTITKSAGNTPYPGRPAWPTFESGYNPMAADF